MNPIHTLDDCAVILSGIRLYESQRNPTPPGRPTEFMVVVDCLLSVVQYLQTRERMGFDPVFHEAGK